MILRRLPLRTRLLLALATVAILPLTLFGAIALHQAASAVEHQQMRDLLADARLVAQQASADEAFRAALIGRLADASGHHVAVFDARARLLVSSDPSVSVPPPAGTPGERVGRHGDRVVAYVALLTTGPAAGTVVALSEPVVVAPQVGTLLLGILALTIIGAVFLGFALARSLVRPVAELTATLERLHAGDLSARMPVENEDEIGRLAESHNRLADALAARNRSLSRVLRAVATLSPREGVATLVNTAERAAVDAFGFIRCSMIVGGGVDPQHGRAEAAYAPGDPVPVAVPLQVGEDRVGTLTATLPATREWSPADRDLLELFGLQLAVAIRNAELFASAESVSELKSEFLRGVSHNLQTPLTSIHAFADQLARENSDRRLSIIVEQSERLSRLVAQLLTVSRIEAGTLRPEVDVFALGPLVRRVWESLAQGDHPFTLDDRAPDWLAAADRDWVEQVVWALLDNALKYGGGGPVEVSVTLTDPPVPSLVTAVRDSGPGIPTRDRERVFERFARLAPSGSEGTGLGLSVARGLVEAMAGRLWLDDRGPGACFCFSLPAERIEES